MCHPHEVSLPLQAETPREGALPAIRRYQTLYGQRAARQRTAGRLPQASR